MGTMGKCTMGAIFYTITSCISFIDTCACLVVAQVVSSLCVPCCAMEIGTSEEGEKDHYRRQS